ncbi:TetR/AcrR family transcriptional regulator [Gordonia sp. PKS22-38]|uniref:TetR/AcrR family transcriptional regulator n=1 Tax=Gordonia prachuapensis TaxID=3115651 RepID=A0ABU7MT91_9ACTN|nr:TetR/AcrR family transcriptional regulator [Gordonia sp. PKS22-38]
MESPAAPVHGAGRRRDPAADVAIREAVLDSIADGATLSGLSLVSVARRAGVSRNSLYRRWSSKDELYLDVLDSINLPITVSAADSTRDALIALLRVLAERIVDRRATAMVRALTAESALFPDLHRRYFDEVVAPRRRTMVEVLNRGVRRGEIRRDVDVEFVAEMLVSPLLARMSAGDINDIDPESTSARITDLVLDGVWRRRPSS